MRQGYSPEVACKKAVERILKLRGDKVKGLQVGFLALNKKGQLGGDEIHLNFLLSTVIYKRIIKLINAIV
jgi:N4-(beta-N-acetylglucosaminyl)-L-asparaginase